MLKNYLKTAWRNLVMNKAFSVINIAGLGLGMCCSLLIMLWVQDERSVDAFHKSGASLFQVYERQSYDGKVEAAYSTPGLLAGELKRVVPEVMYASSMDDASGNEGGNTFEAGDKTNKMQGKFVGEDFFNMFSYPLLQGKAAAVLNDPGTIVISRKMADMFFGSAEAAIGKALRFENKDELLVTGVFENFPANSSLKADFLRSWVDYVKENAWVHNWGNTNPETLIQLRPGADPGKVEGAIKDFIYRYRSRATGQLTELGMQAYPDKYLYGNFKNGRPSGGRIEYVRLFTLLAFFVVLIACINFMNLATARASKRAKEVGLRKVVGAQRSSLIFQFIGEAVLLCLLAVIAALLLASLLLPAFNALTGKQLLVPFNQPVFLLVLTGLVLVTGFVAGSYPALYLSAFNPVRVLKGTLKFSHGAVFFRRTLVVFQFTLSVVLIVGMIVIYRQMDYIRSVNIGYDRENLVYIPIEGELIKQYPLFKQQLAGMPGIVSVSKMRNSPTIIGHHTGDISWPGKDPNTPVSFVDGIVGYDFVKTMKLTVTQGRDFSRDFGTDSADFLLNETAVRQIGFKDPVGQPMVWGRHHGKVIGVIRDFHFTSLHQTIEPMIIHLDENWGWGTVLVRTQAAKTREAIASLQAACHAINPRFPFTYQFSDQEFSRLYRSEEVVGKLANLFAFLAIFISCLGLFGLAAFSAAQRRKEIGVRKVLGASTADIMTMLSGSFLKPVALAMVIGFPLAWLAMSRWLENFAYKTALDWWIFALAGAATLVIALLTVSFQGIKAALANPVKSLRTE